MIDRMRAALCVFTLIAAACASAQAADEEGFRSLFDGKTLAGWEGDKATFRVEEGAIHGGTLKEKIPRNEFLCTTEEFSNFELRFEARLQGEGKNAGVQFRSQRIPDHHEVIGYQCDMGDMADRSIWGSLYDESRRRTMLAHGDAAKLAAAVNRDQWNSVVIRCEGPHIRIWVNDLQTVDYTEPQADIPQTGIIGLQIHGGAPAVASYRNIRIKTLD